MKNILTLVLIVCSMNIFAQQTKHVHTETYNHHSTEKCYTKLIDMFMDGMNMSKKQAEKTIQELTSTAASKSSTGDSTFFAGIFYYPDAPADAGMTTQEYEVELKNFFESSINEYLSSLSFTVHYKVNYVSPMEFFSPDDFANKVFALSDLGQGNYTWTNQRRSEYHLAMVSFIFPFGHPVNSSGLQGEGSANTISNSQRHEGGYVNAFYPSVIEDDKKSVISHEYGHTFGVNHTLSEGDIGGDPNGYAIWVPGEGGTANIPSYIPGATLNAPSSPNLVIDGITYGSAQENARAVVEDEMPFLTGLYEETFVCVNDTTVDVGTTLQLNIVSNGDEIEYEVLSGDITLSGDALTVNSSGQVLVSAKQNDGSVYWVIDTISITANTVLQPPMVNCQNISISLDADGLATVSASDIDNGSTDPDGTIVAITIDNANELTFDCSQIGNNNTVTLTATDNDGLSSSCMATVTVVDDMLPEVSCVGDFTVQLTAGQDTTLDLNDLFVDISDNCSIASVSASQLTFNSMGTFPITIEAIDDSGNETSCNVNITVDIVSSTIDISQDDRISVFPNPSLDLVNIKIEENLEVTQVALYDSAGRIIKMSKYSTEFSLGDVSSGVYILKIVTSKETFITQLSKL